MIPVVEKPEPDGFNDLVRKDGEAFLKATPNPASWDGKDYWKRAAPNLRKEYGGLCAYLACWFPDDTSYDTVDHYLPKSKYPKLAYEWFNYRLASPRMNSLKGNHEDVLDPFKIEYGWFILEIPSFMVKPSPDLEREIATQVQATIHRLKLDRDERFIKRRLQWAKDYADNEISFNFLKRNAPFIAYELERQNLKEDIASILRV